MSLFAELKRRNVFKVGIAYAVVAWLVLQVSDVILNNIAAPGWVFRVIMLVLGIGFPVVLVFAWAFELTPEGLKRESEVDRSQSIATQTGRKLNTAILSLMALAIAYLLYDKFSGGPAAPASTPAQAQAQTAAATEAAPAPDSKVEVPRQSIAVLPFDNRSPDPNDAYFTEGIHDDLLTNLSHIGSLKVISRTSVSRYANTDKSIPEIAHELGVATVMEGAVQRAGNQVRINVQLIDAQTDEHLWAQIYDRELSTENLFAIQSEISESIARALEATLTPEEEQRVNQKPTRNLAAYEAYLRGRQLMARRESASLEQAKAEFRQAVTLDPGFALAWVGLADTHHLLGTYGTLSQKEASPIIQDALDRALAIDDRLGEAYASLGLLRSNQGRWPEAEAAFKKAVALSPNYATAWHWYSNNLKRFPLRADEAIEMAHRAAELDPNSPIIKLNLADAYAAKGMYSVAVRQAQTILELEPGFPPALVALAGWDTFHLGRFVDGLAYMRQAVAADPGNPWPLVELHNLYQALGELEAAAKVRDRIAELAPDSLFLGEADMTADVWRNNAPGFRETSDWILRRFRDEPGEPEFVGWLSLVMGDASRALQVYLANEPGWTDTEQQDRLVNEWPSNACAVAWLLIDQDQAEAGQALLQRATRFLTKDLPAVNEHADEFYPHICQVANGDREGALATMETLAAHNHLIFWDVVHRMPVFDPIRDDPRFIAATDEAHRLLAEQREQVRRMDEKPGP